MFFLFSVDFREIIDVLATSETGRDQRLRIPSAPEAVRLPEDRREHCFVNEKVFKNMRKTMTLNKFVCLGICITKIHCIAMASIRWTEQQHSNCHSFRILILLAFFSAKSAVFRRFKISQTSDAQKKYAVNALE